MKKLAILIAACGILGTVAPASAGCVTGAMVGGIAGHMVGHGVAGAAAGCAVGHHSAAKKEQRAERAVTHAPQNTNQTH